VSPLADARHALAALLSDAFASRPAVTVYAAPPPQPVPPCAVISPGYDYIPPGPVTACTMNVSVVVRLVTAIHEPAAAFDDLDELIGLALVELGRWAKVDAGIARDIAGTTWLTADITVTYTADRRAAPVALVTFGGN
jgi:hypothetical protein